MLNHFSRVQLSVTPWTMARQAPLSMGFSRQEHRSGLPFPSPGDLPHPQIEPNVSCVGRQILYCCATREAHWSGDLYPNLLLFPVFCLWTGQDSPSFIAPLPPLEGSRTEGFLSSFSLHGSDLAAVSGPGLAPLMLWRLH